MGRRRQKQQFGEGASAAGAGTIQLEIVYEVGTVGKCHVYQETADDEVPSSVLSLDLTQLLSAGGGSMVVLIDVVAPQKQQQHEEKELSPELPRMSAKSSMREDDGNSHAFPAHDRVEQGEGRMELSLSLRDGNQHNNCSSPSSYETTEERPALRMVRFEEREEIVSDHPSSKVPNSKLCPQLPLPGEGNEEPWHVQKYIGREVSSLGMDFTSMRSSSSFHDGQRGPEGESTQQKVAVETSGEKEADQRFAVPIVPKDSGSVPSSISSCYRTHWGSSSDPGDVNEDKGGHSRLTPPGGSLPGAVSKEEDEEEEKQEEQETGASSGAAILTSATSLKRDWTRGYSMRKQQFRLSALMTKQQCRQSLLLQASAAQDLGQSHFHVVGRESNVVESPSSTITTATPRLHHLCAQPNVTLEELRKELGDHPAAVTVEDAVGQLPLHILSENEGLLETVGGRLTATDFGQEMMLLYPAAITAKDHAGRMPFVTMIQDWARFVYDYYSKKVMKSAAEESRSKHSRAPPPPARSSSASSSNPSSESLEMDTEKRSRAVVATTATATGLARDVCLRPILWPEVDWCLTMLSFAADELSREKEKDNVEFSFRRPRDRAALAAHVAGKIPGLLRIMLLAQDEDGFGSLSSEDGKEKIVERYSILRRILLCPESVGPWLTRMLQKRGYSGARAVDYLQLVSAATVRDYLGPHAAPATERDVAEFRQERRHVFEAVDALPHTIPSLVGLPEAETERAACTAVIWYTMNKKLRRPFVVSLVLLDLCLHVVLLLAFRDFVNPHRASQESFIGDMPSAIAFAICSHYIIRTACQAMSLWKLSPRVFRSFFTNIWTILDFATIVLTVVSIAWIKYHPDHYLSAFNALVSGLLWIKMLSFLKVVNKQLAAFILSLFQIVRELRYFILVLFIVIIMFADMFHIVLYTKDDGEWCDQNSSNLGNPAQDFCSDIPMDGFLRVYSLMLGNVTSEDWRQTTGMATLFVICTMFGIIILLNILIAVICDLYEDARYRSELLFGRVRALFVAQNRALETWLEPGTLPRAGGNLSGTSGKLFIATGLLFRWLTLISLIGTAMGANVFLISRCIHDASNGVGGGLIVKLIFIGLLIALLSLALFVMIMFAMHLFNRACCSIDFLVVRWCNTLEKKTAIFLGFFASMLFGRSHHGEESKDLFSEEQEWTGRLKNLQNGFERTLAIVKADIIHELKAMEQRFSEQHHHEKSKTLDGE